MRTELDGVAGAQEGRSVVPEAALGAQGDLDPHPVTCICYTSGPEEHGGTSVLGLSLIFCKRGITTVPRSSQNVPKKQPQLAAPSPQCGGPRM